MINTIIYDIQVYMNVAFCIITMIYSVVYLKAHVEDRVWSMIKVVYFIVAMLWLLLYVSIIIDGQFMHTVQEVSLSEIVRLNIIRPLITLTLATMAAGAVLRVKAVGINGKWWCILFKSKNVNGK